jgi:rare lipoprotein A
VSSPFHWTLGLLCILWLGVGCARNVRKEGGREGFLGEGLASYYGPGFHGKKTASGELFDKNDLTAAHRKLRFGSCVHVTSVATGKSIKVRVNDRGPYSGDRIIDLSEAAARSLGIIDRGVSRVRLYAC